jgi:heme O synthase-like polyprenyltransferase
MILGLGYLYFAKRLAAARTLIEARRLLQASVIYLPLLYVLMIADRARS